MSTLKRTMSNEGDNPPKRIRLDPEETGATAQVMVDNEVFESFHTEDGPPKSEILFGNSSGAEPGCSTSYNLEMSSSSTSEASSTGDNLLDPSITKVTQDVLSEVNPDEELNEDCLEGCSYQQSQDQITVQSKNDHDDESVSLVLPRANNVKKQPEGFHEDSLKIGPIERLKEENEANREENLLEKISKDEYPNGTVVQAISRSVELPVAGVERRISEDRTVEEQDDTDIPPEDEPDESNVEPTTSQKTAPPKKKKKRKSFVSSSSKARKASQRQKKRYMLLKFGVGAETENAEDLNAEEVEVEEGIEEEEDEQAVEDLAEHDFEDDAEHVVEDLPKRDVQNPSERIFEDDVEQDAEDDVEEPAENDNVPSDPPTPVEHDVRSTEDSAQSSPKTIEPKTEVAAQPPQAKKPKKKKKFVTADSRTAKKRKLDKLIRDRKKSLSSNTTSNPSVAVSVDREIKVEIPAQDSKVEIPTYLQKGSSQEPSGPSTSSGIPLSEPIMNLPGPSTSGGSSSRQTTESGVNSVSAPIIDHSGEPKSNGVSLIKPTTSRIEFACEPSVNYPAPSSSSNFPPTQPTTSSWAAASSMIFGIRDVMWKNLVGTQILPVTTRAQPERKTEFVSKFLNDQDTEENSEEPTPSDGISSTKPSISDRFASKLSKKKPAVSRDMFMEPAPSQSNSRSTSSVKPKKSVGFAIGDEDLPQSSRTYSEEPDTHHLGNFDIGDFIPDEAFMDVDSSAGPSTSSRLLTDGQTTPQWEQDYGTEIDEYYESPHDSRDNSQEPSTSAGIYLRGNDDFEGPSTSNYAQYHSPQYSPESSTEPSTSRRAPKTRSTPVKRAAPSRSKVVVDNGSPEYDDINHFTTPESNPKKSKSRRASTANSRAAKARQAGKIRRLTAKQATEDTVKKEDVVDDDDEPETPKAAPEPGKKKRRKTVSSHGRAAKLRKKNQAKNGRPRARRTKQLPQLVVQRHVGPWTDQHTIAELNKTYPNPETKTFMEAYYERCRDSAVATHVKFWDVKEQKYMENPKDTMIVEYPEKSFPIIIRGWRREEEVRAEEAEAMEEQEEEENEAEQMEVDEMCDSDREVVKPGKSFARRIAAPKKKENIQEVKYRRSNNRLSDSIDSQMGERQTPKKTAKIRTTPKKNRIQEDFEVDFEIEEPEQVVKPEEDLDADDSLDGEEVTMKKKVTKHEKVALSEEEIKRVENEAERIACEIVLNYNNSLVTKKVLSILPNEKEPCFLPSVIHQLIDMKKYNELPEKIRGICELYHSGIERDVWLHHERYSRSVIFTACRAIYHYLCPEVFKPEYDKFKCLINWLSDDHDDRTVHDRPNRMKKARIYIEKLSVGHEDVGQQICQVFRTEFEISDYLKGSGGSSRKTPAMTSQMNQIKDPENAKRVIKKGFVEITPAVMMILVGKWLITNNSV